MTLTRFFCPTHGFTMGGPAVSLVQCYCGEDCAPEGRTPAEHRKVYLAARRKRDSRYAKGLVTAV